jgi:hypothetical protein
METGYKQMYFMDYLYNRPLNYFFQHQCQVFTDGFDKTAAICVSLNHIVVNVLKLGRLHCVHLPGDSLCYSEQETNSTL